MNTAPSTPSPKPKWGRIGSVVRRTSAKFTKTSGKPGSDGDSDLGSLRQTPSLEVIQTTPSPNSSSSSPPTPPTKSKIGRIGRAVRRASTKLSVSRQGTPSTERDSDSLSLKRTASYEFVSSISPSLSVAAKPVEATLPSPIAESPAREAEEIQRAIVGPSPLAQLSLPPQEVEVPPALETPVTPLADVENQTPSAVEHEPSSVVDFPWDSQTLVHSVEHDPSSLMDSSPGNVEASVHDLPEVDVTVNPQITDSITTPATEERLVVVDLPAVDGGASMADFNDNDSLQNAVLPGPLPLRPRRSRDQLYYHPNASESSTELDSDEELDEASAPQLGAWTYPEMANPFLPTEPPATLVDAPSEVSPPLVLPVTIAQTAVPEIEQVMVVRQTENISSSFEDSSVPNLLSSAEIYEVPLPPVAPIVVDNAPAPAKNEKTIPIDMYVAVPLTTHLSPPPPAYTVDHFPSPNPNAHLVTDPEKAAVTPRPPKKDPAPLKSVLKPSRPISTVSTTNNALEDFRIRTLVVVVGAVASIVATAMLFLRR